MERRTFIQSLLAGAASLAVPSVSRVVRAKAPGGAEVELLERVYVLLPQVGRLSSLGTAVDLGPHERVRLVFRQEQDGTRVGSGTETTTIPAAVRMLATAPWDPGDQVEAPGTVVLAFPNAGMIFPEIDAIVFADGAPIDHPVVTPEAPFVIEARSVVDRPMKLALGVYYDGVDPRGDCFVPPRLPGLSVHDAVWPHKG